MKKTILILALMAMTVAGMNAEETVPQPNKVPARRTMMVFECPNGYKLRTYLRGDEHIHWRVTEDGWQILENDEGWFKYAKRNRKGETVPHWRKAHNAEDRGRCEQRWLKKKGIRK